MDTTPHRTSPGQPEVTEPSSVRDPTADPASTLHQADIRDAVEAVERQEMKITFLSLLALACMFWVLMEAPAHLAIPWTVVTLVGLKAAVREYLSLAAGRKQILREAEPQDRLPGKEGAKG